MIKDILETILSKYPIETKRDLKNYQFASYIRNDVPHLLNKELKLPVIYTIKASPGNGAWAKIPWIAIFDKSVTETVRNGICLVYLFCADFSGVYLSLMQGYMQYKSIYGIGNSRKLLKQKADFFRKVVSTNSRTEFEHKVDLKVETISKQTTARRLGKAYESANIFARYYSAKNLPSSQVMVNDLLNHIDLYEQVIENSFADDTEELEFLLERGVSEQATLIEDLSKSRIHKRVERNQALVKKVKEAHGYICKACGFDFESYYGSVGKNYIEAHHLVPLKNLEKTTIAMNPLEDFTVLCSN